MFKLDEHNAIAWLCARNWIAADEVVSIRRLTGGVSNDVFRVERSGKPDFILKQARGQLRVLETWTCSVERIWRERDVMQSMHQLLVRELNVDSGPQAQTPNLLNHDQPDYVLAISAAPRESENWKEQLLARHIDERVGRSAGQMLAAIHARAWGDRELEAKFGDSGFFDALRIDPYYRHVARARPELAEVIADLEASLEANCLTLVHGDFSPKNLLVSDEQLMLLDFEVGHFGDPAFDLGFFLTHLALKTSRCLHREWKEEAAAMRSLTLSFCQAYEERFTKAIAEPDCLALWRRTAAHWAACILARLDGKSQVDYLADETKVELRLAFTAMLLNPPTHPRLLDLAAHVLEQLG